MSFKESSNCLPDAFQKHPQSLWRFVNVCLCESYGGGLITQCTCLSIIPTLSIQKCHSWSNLSQCFPALVSFLFSVLSCSPSPLQYHPPVSYTRASSVASGAWVTVWACQGAFRKSKFMKCNMRPACLNNDTPLQRRRRRRRREET